jgi:hypothetical protein
MYGLSQNVNYANIHHQLEIIKEAIVRINIYMKIDTGTATFETACTHTHTHTKCT